MTRALHDAADSLGEVSLGDTIGDRRFLFADEIVSWIICRSCGGETRMNSTLKAISDGIGDFLVFADAAIYRYLADHGAFNEGRTVSST